MTTYPSPAVPVFSAGYDPQVADFTSWVTNAFGFLSSGVVFRGVLTTAQAFAASTVTLLEINTVLEDPYSGWSAAGYYYVPPYPGYYEMTVNFQAANATATGILEAQIWKNGTSGQQVGSQQTPAGVANVPGGCSGEGLFACNGISDGLQAFIYSSVATTANTTAGRQATLEIAWISD